MSQHGKTNIDADQSSGTPGGYNPALDSIRGIAVLCVVLMHAEHYFFDADLNWLPGGFLGVDIFFVLSGFLITHILLDSFKRYGRLNYKIFYLNRALRLFPALALLLVAYYAYTQLSGQAQAFETEAIVSIVFYYFNWFLVSTLQTPEGLGHMWSLAVEEQFYLLWPVVLALLLRKIARVRSIAYFIFLMISAVAIWRAYLWHVDTNWLFMYVRTDTRADSILVGALMACLLSKNLLHIPNIKFLSSLSAAVLLLSMFSFNRETPFLYMGGFTLIAILASVLIYHATAHDKEKVVFFDWAPLRWLGKISYGVYLWHMPIFSLVSTQKMIESGYSQALIAFALLLAVTLFSWFIVERPFLRLKVHL